MRNSTSKAYAPAPPPPPILQPLNSVSSRSVSSAATFDQQTCPHSDTTLISWSSLFGTGSLQGRQLDLWSGQAVLLDSSPSGILGSLTIHAGARLVFGPAANLALHSQLITVRGLLAIGSEGCPRGRAAPASITLYCCTSHSAFGSKAIVVEGGGRLELHGSLGGAPSWTRLGQTIEPYSDIVHVSEALTAGAWQPGDQIILAPTDWYGEDHVDETEVRTISARLSTTSFRLTTSVSHRHYSGRPNDLDSWVKGEVGLLTRPIVLQGDASSSSDLNGGQMILIRGSVSHVEGVEITRMGQSGVLGRYPWHWHLAGSVTGSYLRSSALHHNFQRCVVVHRTHNALIEENVCADTRGHMYVLEDGAEVNNTFAKNLGILARVPPSGRSLVPSEDTPALFWITHPWNRFYGNAIAAASHGYWYALPFNPLLNGRGSVELSADDQLELNQIRYAGAGGGGGGRRVAEWASGR